MQKLSSITGSASGLMKQVLGLALWVGQGSAQANIITSVRTFKKTPGIIIGHLTAPGPL